MTDRPEPKDTEQDQPEDGDGARVRHRRLSWIWLIPVASLAIGGWLLFRTLTGRGPTIDVTFETAEGLKAGESQVKYKDIQMGTVESFDLADDRKVVVHVRMDRKAEKLLTEGAEFWVVKPRLFAGDITGLNTVVAGNYMEMHPGEEGQPSKRKFAGLEDPPALDPGAKGRRFHLTSPRLGGISVGSPVFFREVEVGKVLGWKLVGMAESVDLDVFVAVPYEQWVHDDSRFWNTSGITVKLGAEGVQLQVNSLKAALLGGISFETPNKSSAQASAAGHSFPLYLREETAEAMTAPRRVDLLTYVTGTVGGLAKGAPVTLMGLRVGEVTDVQLQFDTDNDRPRARVAFLIELDRATVVGGKPAPELPEGFAGYVREGLRASLKGGNLLTGQKTLALEMTPDAASAEVGHEDGLLVIPSVGGGGGFDELEASANELLQKIGKMPFEQIGQNLNGALAGVGKIANGPELKQALARLSGTLQTVQETVKHLDSGAVQRLPAIATQLQDTLTSVKSLVASVSDGSAGNSRFGRDLDLLLAQVADAAQSVRAVADLLSRHPEALIRGRVTRVAE